MGLLKSEMTEKNLCELEFFIDRAAFDSAVSRVYQRKARSINVPGFRRGKAPRSVIEKMYGSGVFYEDAINDILPGAYAGAVAEAKVVTVSRPEFDVSSIDENGVTVTAKVYLKPETAISDYFGITAAKKTTVVTEDEVTAEINTARERNSRMVEVEDRPAANGDTVTIDFDGSVDGIPFDGGKAEGHSLTLGSGQFIPGFEEQVEGKNIGDEFDVNVTFPEEYHAAELAGKPAVFRVKLHAVKEKQLPETDDEFARDVSEFDTIDEYKADIRAKIQARHENEADRKFEEKLIDVMVEKLEADIPEPMFEAECENSVRDFDNRLRMQGLDLSSYFKYTGLDLDKLREQFRPQAERQVKCRLALEKIAELENIAASEEEIEDEYKKIAESYNIDAEQVKQSIDAESLALDIKVKHAIELVKEKAIIIEEEETGAPGDDESCEADGDKAEDKAGDNAEDKADDKADDKAGDKSDEPKKKPPVKAKRASKAVKAPKEPADDSEK